MASAVDAARAAALSAFLSQVTPREADLAAAEATPADAQPNLGHFEGSTGRVRWVHSESDGPSQGVVATTPEEPRAAAASPALLAADGTEVARASLAAAALALVAMPFSVRRCDSLGLGVAPAW